MGVDIEKRNKRQYAWRNENKDRIEALCAKGTKEKVKTAAAAAGISPTQWVQSAIDEKLEREN